MNLAELQKTFIAAVLFGENATIAPALAEGGISPSGQMGIYRNNSFGTLTNALALTYPAVRKLVGEAFFERAGYAFIEARHPVNSNLDDYGAEFAEFLADFPPAQALAYLPDMARLEWQVHQSAIAEKGVHLDQSAIAAIPQDKYFSLHLKPHSSARLVRSRFPVHKILDLCLGKDAESTATLDLAEESGVRLLLLRPRKGVELTVLSTPEYAFLEAIFASGNFFAAFEAAAQADEAFDLAACMQRHISLGTFGGFSVGL